MSWEIYALGSALLHAIYFTLTKKLTKRVPTTLFIGLSLTFTGFLFLIYHLIFGFPTLTKDLFPNVFYSIALFSLFNYLLARAVKETDISLAFPMIAFTPAFQLVLSPIIRNEYPSLLGVVGVLIVVFGAYLLRAQKGILEPFKHLKDDRGVQLALGASFVVALGSNFDKTVLLSSSPTFAAMCMLGVSGSLFLIFSVATKKHQNIPRSDIIKSTLSGTVPVFSATLMLTALQSSLVPYVFALKRTSLLFNLFFAHIFFKEKELGFRAIGTVVMIFGVVVIVVAG